MMPLARPYMECSPSQEYGNRDHENVRQAMAMHDAAVIGGDHARRRVVQWRADAEAARTVQRGSERDAWHAYASGAAGVRDAVGLSGDALHR